MFFKLEETSSEEWEKLESRSEFVEVVCELFLRLSRTFKNKQLPCFFIPDMNLLDGYQTEYLNKMATLFQDIAIEWRDGQTNGRNVEIIKDFYSQVIPIDPDEKNGLEKLLSAKDDSYGIKSFFWSLFLYVLCLPRWIILLAIYIEFLLFHSVKDLLVKMFTVET